MLSIHPTVLIRRPVFRAKVIEEKHGPVVMIHAEDAENLLARSSLALTIDEAEQLIREVRQAIDTHYASRAALPA